MPSKVRAPILQPSLTAIAATNGKRQRSAAHANTDTLLGDWGDTSGLKSRRSGIEAVPPLLLPILLPSRWTTPVPGGQLWNVDPAHGPQRTALDDAPIPTDLKVVPAACPMGWSAEGYHGRSRTTPQEP